MRLAKDLEGLETSLAYEKAMGATVEPLDSSAWLIDRGEKYGLVVKRARGTARVELKKKQFTAEQAKQLLPRLTSWDEADAYLSKP